MPGRQAEVIAPKRQVYIPMSAVLRHAARKGWCAMPLLQHPRVKPPKTKWSTPERLARLLPHCSPKLRRLVVFLTYTGARISEALRVDWEADVQDLGTHSIGAAQGKTQSGRGRCDFP